MKRGIYEIKLNGASDYQRLHSAVELRVEACFDNGEMREFRSWLRLLRKIEKITKKGTRREKKS